MSDTLNKTTPVTTGIASQSQISNEDENRVGAYLNEQFGYDLFADRIGDSVFFADDQGEVVGGIDPDGLVWVLIDGEYYEFHISELDQKEDEEFSEEDWRYLVEDLFRDESKSGQTVWTPSNNTQNENSAAKFSSTGQKYIQDLPPMPKVSELIESEDSSDRPGAHDDAPESAAEIESSGTMRAAHGESVPALPTTDPEGVISNANPIPSYEPTPSDTHIPSADTVSHSWDAGAKCLLENKPVKTDSCPDAKPAQKWIPAHASDPIRAGVQAFNVDVHEPPKDIDRGELPQSSAGAKPHAGAKGDSVHRHSVGSSRSIELHGERGKGNTPKRLSARNPSDSARISASPKAGKGSASDGPQPSVSWWDPFAIACASADKGSPVYLSNISSPMAASSFSDASSRDVVLPARDSEGHSERQGHDRDEGDQSSQDPDVFDDSDEEDRA